MEKKLKIRRHPREQREDDEDDDQPFSDLPSDLSDEPEQHQDDRDDDEDDPEGENPDFHGCWLVYGLIILRWSGSSTMELGVIS